MSKIWLDITNTPQVHFLLAIYEALEKRGDFDCTITAREFSETAKLLEQKSKYPFKVLGGHYGKSYAKKILGLFYRFGQVFNLGVDFDVSISCGSENAVWNSFIKRKKSIAFGDNDLARQWTYGHFVDYAFFPDAISKEKLESQGLKSKKLYMYPGFKEDLYLADFKPDSTFPKSIPFDEYVIVRPENIMANYIRNKQAKSITPELLKGLTKSGYNVLYLPRYDLDKAYAHGLKNVFIPDEPINGLNASYYSIGVLTGAGTFAREAACLGVPSFSFFAGSDLLSVDKKLISEGKIFYSRDASELLNKLSISKKTVPDTKRSKDVRDKVINHLYNVIIN